MARTKVLVERLLDEAAALSESGRPENALRLLLSARRRFSFVPISILTRAIVLCRELRREQLAAEESLVFAGDCFDMGLYDLGLEAASASLMFDNLGSLAITRNPARLCAMTRWYEQVAQLAGARGAAPAPRRAGPLRVAILVPSLVDHVVAYTKTVLDLVRHADASRYAFRVYVSENLVRRDRHLFPFGTIGDPTPVRGACALSELRERGIPVEIASRAALYREAGLSLAGRMDRDGVEAILAITGVACPIDWLALRMSGAPLRAALHIGSSLFMPGLDVTYYDNPANVAREDTQWTDAFGDRAVFPLGTDIAILEKQAPLERAALGIPESAVVIGALSNHLVRRMSADYVETIASVLARHPRAWFLGVGTDRVPEAERIFRERGVAARVRFIGQQARVGPALKVFDVYANEFPVGGSTSVMEAMACGVPVVALRWSDAHAECAGAEIVGPEMAVPGPDVPAYCARLEAWVADSGLRREAAGRCRARARERYAVDRGVRALLDDLGRRHEARCSLGTCGEGRPHGP
jgi:glycosyltransferase involved in cell wall biosynthesis